MAVINIEDAVRVFVVAITIGSMIFFSIEYSRKRAGWEVLWVAGIEALNYTLGMTLPFEYLPVYGPYDMPMTRYLSWMLTCPVLSKVARLTLPIVLACTSKLQSTPSCTAPIVIAGAAACTPCRPTPTLRTTIRPSSPISS